MYVNRLKYLEEAEAAWDRQVTSLDMQLIELKAKFDKSTSELEAYQTASKGMLEKEQSEILLHKTHDLERKNTELLAGVNTYRSLFDVAANQARTLKLTGK